MYLSNIKLWNFRKFGHEGEFDLTQSDLDLNLTKGLNVIIGENDSGKTAIIDAVKLVLKTHSYEYIRTDEKDFHGNSTRFRIELIFSDLEIDEAKNFTEWLSWTGAGAEAKPILRLIFDVRRQASRILPAEVKGGADEEGYALSAEAREYLKVTYLKPLRDAENELIAKRNSRLSQILLADEAFKGREDDNDLLTIYRQLHMNLERYFRGEFESDQLNEAGEKHKPLEGKLIKDKIDGYVKAFYGVDREIEFASSSIDTKGILEKMTLLLSGEQHPGLGTLNRLFMSAELLHLDKANWTGLRLGLVEELEAHLHPQAQMQVIEALQSLDSIQLILTTHSPNLASKLKLKNLIVCENSHAFPMGPSFTELDEDNYVFLEKFLDTTKANLFFATGVILVEGWAEEILLPSIAKAIGVNLTERGVSVVNVGHTGFDHYRGIFLRKNEPHISIPVAVITDSDVREYEKDENGSLPKRNTDEVRDETNEKIAAIAKKTKQSVRYFVAPNWTLEYSLLKSTSLREPFKTAVKEVHTKTPWDNDFEYELANKLVSKRLKKTEIAYRLARAIDEDLTKDPNDRSINIKNENDEVNVEDESEEAAQVPVKQADTIDYLVNAIRYAAGIDH